MTILRLAKIQLFSRVSLKAPDVLCSLIKDMAVAGIGWSKSIMEDFKWLTFCPKFEDHRDYSFHEWMNHCKMHGKALCKGAKKFATTRFANIPPKEELQLAVQSHILSYSCSMCE